MKWILAILCLMATMSGIAQPEKGQQAPIVNLPDPDGMALSLESFQGKMVLVDFWASWCGPCRYANKRIKPLYRQYQEKGFEIFSISVDDDANAWLKAIKADNITWPQVHEAGGWQATVARQWKIDYLPTTFLLNKEGVIVAVDPSLEELKKMLAHYLPN